MKRTVRIEDLFYDNQNHRPVEFGSRRLYDAFSVAINVLPPHYSNTFHCEKSYIEKLKKGVNENFLKNCIDNLVFNQIIDDHSDDPNFVTIVRHIVARIVNDKRATAARQ